MSSLESNQHGPEEHPLQSRLLLKKQLEKSSGELNKHLTYNNYQTASKSLERYMLSLNVVTPSKNISQVEFKKIDALRKDFFSHQLYFFHSHILFMCTKELSDNPKKETIESLHGVLCLLLRDCQEYQGVVDEEKRGDFIDLRIQTLDQLRKNHVMLGQKKDAISYEHALSTTRGELSNFQEEMNAKKSLPIAQ